MAVSEHNELDTSLDLVSNPAEVDMTEEDLELESLVNSLSDEEERIVTKAAMRCADEECLPAITLNEDGIFEIPHFTGHEGIDSMLFDSRLTEIYGLNHHIAGRYLGNQLRRMLVTNGTGASQINQVLALVSEIKPRDGIEAMLANQMVAIQLLTMDSISCALHPEQSIEGKSMYLREINKLSRTFTAQMEALNRHRGKGQQKMTVEHVQVNQGGQAIIGSVTEREAQNSDSGVIDRGGRKKS